MTEMSLRLLKDADMTLRGIYERAVPKVIKEDSEFRRRLPYLYISYFFTSPPQIMLLFNFKYSFVLLH